MTDSGRLTLHLADADATLALGKRLAQCLPPGAPFQTILLYGDLGAGKTTLIRGLVEALPGGDEAEVSSPSFNLCNLYPTSPETAHFDLYRLDEGCADDTLAETWEMGRSLVLVEWADRLALDCVPDSRLELVLSQDGEGRSGAFTAHGEAMKWLDALHGAA